MQSWFDWNCVIYWLCRMSCVYFSSRHFPPIHFQCLFSFHCFYIVLYRFRYTIRWLYCWLAFDLFYWSFSHRRVINDTGRVDIPPEWGKSKSIRSLSSNVSVCVLLAIHLNNCIRHDADNVERCPHEAKARQEGCGLFLLIRIISSLSLYLTILQRPFVCLVLSLPHTPWLVYERQSTNCWCSWSSRELALYDTEISTSWCRNCLCVVLAFKLLLMDLYDVRMCVCVCGWFFSACLFQTRENVRMKREWPIFARK